jgi:type IV secretory pathway protease TraF
MRVNKRELKNVAGLVFCAVGLAALFFLLRLRINVSSSHVPAGIWRAHPVDAIDVGDVVTYDVRDFYRASPRIHETRLRFATPRIIKRVAALPGALIERSGDAVSIDGKEYPRAKIVDESWCAVDYPLVVPEGSVWLMADAERAWDSRYHGPLPADLIREKNTPVLVWRPEEPDEELPGLRRAAPQGGR